MLDDKTKENMHSIAIMYKYGLISELTARNMIARTCGSALQQNYDIQMDRVYSSLEKALIKGQLCLN